MALSWPLNIVDVVGISSVVVFAIVKRRKSQKNQRKRRKIPMWEEMPLKLKNLDQERIKHSQRRV